MDVFMLSFNIVNAPYCEAQINVAMMPLPPPVLDDGRHKHDCHTLSILTVDVKSRSFPTKTPIRIEDVRVMHD